LKSSHLHRGEDFLTRIPKLGAPALEGLNIFNFGIEV
jgi:hypothetical protein